MRKTKVKNCEELLKEIKTSSEKINDPTLFNIQIMVCYQSEDGIDILQLPAVDLIVELANKSGLMALVRKFVKDTHPEMVIMLAPVSKHAKGELIPTDAVMMLAETPTKTRVFIRNITNGVLDDKWEDMLPEKEDSTLVPLLGTFFTEPPENVDKIKDKFEKLFDSLDAPKTDVPVLRSSEKID